MADKALLIGINRFKKISGLRGCVNDVENIRKLLIESYGFRPPNVKVLTDERAVKSEVRKQMKWLFKDAAAGDRVILHCSTHGSYTVDLDGDEEDAVDELVCLYDMDFNDADTYLLDDELKKWTESVPEGVDLTVILDSCHSGTGTRLLLAPMAGKSQPVPMPVDVAATVSRSLEAQRGLRGVEMADAVNRAIDPANENLVLVRFVEPPPAIKEAAARRPRAATRGFVKADLNHTLLAGCRSDQTSADATIEGTPNGAFSFYLCKTLRENGTEISRREVINRVEQALRAENFSQIPQLEASTADVPLFGALRASQEGSGQGEAGPADTLQSTSAHGITFQQLDALLEKILRLSPEAQLAALSLLKQGGTGARVTAEARPAANRHLVYVHGICEHTAGYSTSWWNALDDYTTVFGAGRLNETRHEVLWSNLVNQRAVISRSLSAPDLRALREVAEEAQLEADIRAVLEDRAERHALDSPSEGASLAETRAMAVDRGLLAPFHCIDDFTVYMVNEETRTQVIQRFIEVMQKLLNGSGEIDIISHSWGTVVAYEGLRELEARGVTGRRVRNFLTVGSALSIGPVRMRLRSANKDGRRPSLVRRWVNVDARGDIVGGPLKGRFQVDEEFPNVEPFGCSGLFKAKCAHESYFKSGNVAVNRDIFARFINQS